MYARRRSLGDEASVLWNYLFPSAASSTAAGQAEIGSVVTNAIAANNAAIAAGIPAPYDIPTIQAAALAQGGAYALEVQKLYAPSIADPTTWPWYVWLGIGVGGLWILTRK